MADAASAPSTPATPSAPAESSQNETNVVELPKKEASDAKDAPSKPVESDDDELDVFGEKVSRKAFRELREIEKRRKEFDRAAHAKMQEAAAKRKENEAREAEFVRLANALKEDPWALHRGQGMTDEQLNELAEQRLVAQIKRAQMSPEQIEAERLRARVAELESEKTKGEQTAREARQAELKAKYVAQYDQLIAEGMQKANLARTRESARKVAAVMAKYAEVGEQIDPAIAAQIVKEDSQTEIAHELTELLTSNPQAAMAMIPEQLQVLIRKAAISEAKEFQPQKQKSQPSNPQPPKRAEPLTFEEARKKLGIRGF